MEHCLYFFHHIHMIPVKKPPPPPYFFVNVAVTLKIWWSFEWWSQYVCSGGSSNNFCGNGVSWIFLFYYEIWNVETDKKYQIFIITLFWKIVVQWPNPRRKEFWSHFERASYLSHVCMEVAVFIVTFYRFGFPKHISWRSFFRIPHDTLKFKAFWNVTPFWKDNHSKNRCIKVLRTFWGAPSWRVTYQIYNVSRNSFSLRILFSILYTMNLENYLKAIELNKLKK